MNIEIPFDCNWKNVAISVSGGADSALLAYLVCNKISTSNLENITVHVISHVRCWKTKPWQQYDSLNVYNWLLKNFSKIKFERHVSFIAPELEWGQKGPSIVDEYGKLVSGDNVQQRAYAEYICFKHNIEAYYNGVTRNPKNVNFKGMPTRDIDATDDNKHLEKMVHMGKMVFHPFRFVEKDKIIASYLELKLLDLLKITRSCEGEFESIDYKTYTPGQYVPLCSKCFWCKERSWAMEVNEITQEIFL